ncbi:hypothetical protein [Pseudodesulfovibrio nedwellii]|nr:hypothetical protein [Pseudodesulfovibrio nedwellii]
MKEEHLFKDRPMEPGTTVLGAQAVVIDDLDVLLEIWSWDAFTGHSAILIEEQVVGKDDSEIIKTISSIIPIGRDHTVSRKLGFVFINYGFKDYEDLLFGN